MYYARQIEGKIKEVAKSYPAIALLGPRQSGKTTLVKKVFTQHKYFNLEELDIRDLAKSDPRRFLELASSFQGVIIDEIQHAPELLSYIQAKIDTNRVPGFFILTGSQNILISQHINQSLAGRIAILTLLPFSIDELKNKNELSQSIDEMLFKGFYPPILANHMDSQDWQDNYIRTYVERDVRQIKNITNLSLFQKFIKLCAGRIGQVLNLTSLGSDCGIDSHTAKSWISILESTYVIFLLQPYHQNFNKRLIKMPKLFFYDVGLACRLLEIQSSSQLSLHHLRGNLFESMIIVDLVKQRFNQGRLSNLYFWRDQTGNEIDCILDYGEILKPLEIKSSQTINSEYFDTISKWQKITGAKEENSYLIYGGDLCVSKKIATVVSWKESGKLNEQL